MQDIYSQFFAQVNNQSIEAEDSSALDQCMDLAFKWCDTLGIDRAAIRHQYAFQIWTQPSDLTRKYFDLIPNSASNNPLIGDLVVFKQISGIPQGHISIETGKSDSMNAITLDQNWDTLHYYHLDSHGNHIPYTRTVVHYGYYGVAGWLHPKTSPNAPGDDVLVNKIQAVVNGSQSPRDKIQAVRQLLA